MEGLKSSEVEEKRKKYGSNKLPDPEKKTWVDFAKEALTDKIVMILIIIAGIQVLLGCFGITDLTDPIMIIVVLCIVTAIGVKTGLGVQTSSELLRAKTSTRYCNVIRDGNIQTIHKNDIVVDDIVCLETGQEIYADGYIIEGEISVSNAAINGETKEIQKSPVKGYISKDSASTSTDDYISQNCLFAGTTVMEGSGRMHVTAVGIHTVNGDTMVRMQTLEPPKTALDIALDQLADFISKWGSIAAFGAFIMMFILEIGRTGLSNYFGQEIFYVVKDLVDKLSIALTVIVAAVPEGLPLIVKLVTKQNVSTMEKAHILAKNPNKIPEMAYLNLVCTDKTGTLTTGKMTPEIMVGVNNYSFIEKFRKNDTPLLKYMLPNIMFNTESAYDEKGMITGGNSIDRALLSLVTKETWEKGKKEKKIVKKQPFSSKLKFSSVTIKNDTSVITYLKGAPEAIIEKCSFYLDKQGNKCPLSSTIKEEIGAELHIANINAIRCIGFALKENEPEKTNEIPDGLIYVGFVGVRDPLREGVIKAVSQAKTAGIQVIEMTGDALETAVAIAEEAGIFSDGDIALTDQEFMNKSDQEIINIFSRLKVIARCAPATKLRLVKIAQSLGLSVAMTGDGTNDSPALKRSDVGFAMNSGTDVAKEAGDIILTDNNFASIIHGIKLGRTFMHNINMFLDFQLPINIALLILNFLYPIWGKGAFLTSVLILVINIIMDSLNSISFGGEPPKEEYMIEKPLKKGAGLFTLDSKTRIGIATGSFIFIYGLLMFSPVCEYFKTDSQSLAARFALICIMAVVNGFCVRVEGLNLIKGIGKNKLFPAIAVGIILGTIFICNCASNLFQVAALTGGQWGILIILSLLIIPIDSIRKIVTKKGNLK